MQPPDTQVTQDRLRTLIGWKLNDFEGFAEQQHLKAAACRGLQDTVVCKHSELHDMMLLKLHALLR